jgi:hypothetical protein
LGAKSFGRKKRNEWIDGFGRELKGEEMASKIKKNYHSGGVRNDLGPD